MVHAPEPVRHRRARRAHAGPGPGPGRRGGAQFGLARRARLGGDGGGLLPGRAGQGTHPGGRPGRARRPGRLGRRRPGRLPPGARHLQPGPHRLPAGRRRVAGPGAGRRGRRAHSRRHAAADRARSGQPHRGHRWPSLSRGALHARGGHGRAAWPAHPAGRTGQAHRAAARRPGSRHRHAGPGRAPSRRPTRPVTRWRTPSHWHWHWHWHWCWCWAR
jgi:hypothetical protein